MKVLNQLTELLDDCKRPQDHCFGMHINNEGASLVGVSQNTLSPISAIIFLRLNQQVCIKGWYEGSYYEFSTFEKFDVSKPITVGVDGRKASTKIYFQIDSSIIKLHSHSNMAEEDMAIIFWEIEQQACLTICALDPNREEVIRESVSATLEPLKKFLRGIALQHMQLQKANVNTSSLSNEDNNWPEEGTIFDNTEWIEDNLQ